MVGFNQQANNWDTPRRMERAQRIAAEIKRQAGLQAEWRGLEFGCGTGLISFALQDSLATIHCVDTADNMIEVLQEKIEARKYAHITAACQDITVESLSAGQYDCVFTSMALHHVEDVPAVLARLQQALKPGGVICIVELDEDKGGAFHAQEADFRGHHGFRQEELKSDLQKVGFQAVQAATFYQGVKDDGQNRLPYSLFWMTGKKKEA